MAIPNPLKPATGGLFEGLDQPQFFYSQTGGAFSLTDGAFIATCDYILKTYQATGEVGQPPVNPAGCNSVPNCQSALTSAGFFQSYGFTPPA